MVKDPKPPVVDAHDLSAAAAVVTGALTTVFDCLDRVRAAAVAVHHDVVARGDVFSPDDLATLRPVILEELRRHPVLDGLGLLTAPDLFADRVRCIEWWRQDVDAVVPLWLNFDPASVDIYDYLEMEWFVRAQRDHASVVFGPYVDYTGADHYVLTISTPVIDGSFLGVVGGDVLMSRFEAQVMPALYALDAEVALVNAERRVVSTNTPRFTVGTRLATRPEPGVGEVADVIEVGADSGWVLVALAPR